MVLHNIPYLNDPSKAEQAQPGSRLVLSGSRHVGTGVRIPPSPAFTYGKLYDLGWYPAMTVGTDKVFGELIEFDHLEILKRVDYLEGFRGVNHPHNYYERREVDVFVGGDTVKAWVYFLSVEQVKRYDGHRLTTGVWSIQ